MNRKARIFWMVSCACIFVLCLGKWLLGTDLIEEKFPPGIVSTCMQHSSAYFSLDRKQDNISVDIFSPEGKYLYRSLLQLGDETPLYTHVEKVIIRGNHCYALLEDGSGKSIFAKYKISLPSTQ